MKKSIAFLLFIVLSALLIPWAVWAQPHDIPHEDPKTAEEMFHVPSLLEGYRMLGVLYIRELQRC